MAKRKFFQQPQRTKEPRTNHQIRVPKIAVVFEGKGIEIMDTRDALAMAESQGLDLVEVSPEQDPPVCKIIDYGKYKYEQQKKKKDQTRNQHIIHVKEIKMKPKIGTHDYEIKKNHAMEFLDKGDKVKATLRFRGREITHPELGMALMDRLVQDVKDVGQVETPAKMEGRQIIMVIAPTRKKSGGGNNSNSGGGEAKPKPKPVKDAENAEAKEASVSTEAPVTVDEKSSSAE